MERNNDMIRDVEKKIKSGKPVEVSFPIINDQIKDLLHHCTGIMLKKYNRMDLEETLYSSIKELVINGVKANMKHYYFKVYDIKPDSIDSINKGYAMLKEKLNVDELHKFEDVSIENDLRIKVTFRHSGKKIITIVENNTPMTKYEDQRIRDKFTKALQYDNIAEFYLENADDVEGSGLGITMIVLMLKSLMIDPHAFTICTNANKTTVATLEIPLGKTQ